jgi:hypothetical protein
MLKTKTTATSQPWNLDLRVRVGQSYSNKNKIFISRTGINTEPLSESVNWSIVYSEATESRPIVIINGNEFTLDKHPDNITNNTIAINDLIFNGWWDSTEYWKAARFIGTDIAVKTDWQVLDKVEEIPIN